MPFTVRTQEICNRSLLIAQVTKLSWCILRISRNGECVCISAVALPSLFPRIIRIIHCKHWSVASDACIQQMYWYCMLCTAKTCQKQLRGQFFESLCIWFTFFCIQLANRIGHLEIKKNNLVSFFPSHS